MKKFIISILIAVFILFGVSVCNVDTGEFEPTNQLCKTGTVVSVSGGQVQVDVAGNVFEFEGTNFAVGDSVRVYFDTNGEPTNPWVWWVIDVK